MRDLVIMPAMAQNQSRFNLGEYAEEVAIIQDEPTVQPSVNFFGSKHRCNHYGRAYKQMRCSNLG